MVRDSGEQILYTVDAFTDARLHFDEETFDLFLSLQTKTKSRREVVVSYQLPPRWDE